MVGVMFIFRNYSKIDGLFFYFEVGAIIITPTRELAKQIEEVFRHFTQELPQLRSVFDFLIQNHATAMSIAINGFYHKNYIPGGISTLYSI